MEAPIRSIVLLLAGLLAACSNPDPALVAVSQPGRVTRGPQIAQVTTTSAIIAWRSEAAEIGAVEFGPDPALGAEVAETAATTEHVVTLTGLAPGTRYHYRVKLRGEPASEGHEFSTVPADPAAPFRFVAIGDSGTGTPEQAGIAEQIRAAAPDLLVHTGDVVYPGGDAEDIDPHYFEPYQDLVDRIPFYTSLGNHDADDHLHPPLLDALYLPANSANGSERFYSFDRGDAHFVALDTTRYNALSGQQLAWLEADLAATSARWIFVYMHHPPYSSSNHGSDTLIRDSLCPLFDRHGVDIVFCGHDHDYERTLPLFDETVVDASGEPDYVDPGGTVYVVTGGGGRGLYASGTDYFTAYSESIHHLVQVDVHGNRLSLAAVDIDGNVIDTMSITKTR